MRARSALAVLLCTSFALVACGGDDGGGSAGGGDGLSDAEQEYADAWAGTLEDGDETSVQVTSDEAACMGEAIMAELGLAPFEEAGVEAADINQDGDEDDSPGEVLGTGVVSEAQADAILDEWEDCADLAEAFAASLAVELELDDDAAQCVEEGLADGDLVRDGYRASFVTDEDEPPADVIQALLAVVDECTGGSEGGGSVSSALVTSIAEGLAAGSDLTDAEAECLAEGIIAEVGQERLLEVSADGSFENAPADVQAEIGQAVIVAAGDCDIPLADLGG